MFAEATPVHEEDHITEQIDALALEANDEVVPNVSEIGEIKVEKKDELVAEVVDEDSSLKSLYLRWFILFYFISLKVNKLQCGLFYFISLKVNKLQ